MSENQKELICIVCPKGCHLSVSLDDMVVSGNECKRGEAYAKAELTNPTRVLTSTVKLTGGLHPRLPVKSSAPLPKGMLLDAMRLLDDIEVVSPVACGDIIIKNILNTGVDFLVTRDM